MKADRLEESESEVDVGPDSDAKLFDRSLYLKAIHYNELNRIRIMSLQLEFSDGTRTQVLGNKHTSIYKPDKSIEFK